MANHDCSLGDNARCLSHGKPLAFCVDTPSVRQLREALAVARLSASSWRQHAEDIQRAARSALALAMSMIESGERMTPTARARLDMAMRELASSFQGEVEGWRDGRARARTPIHDD